MRRGIGWWAVLAVLALLAFLSLRRLNAPPPAEDEIDDASKEALHEVLKQEPE